MFHDSALQGDERGDAAAASPADPAVEHFFAGGTLEHECHPQALVQQVGAVQARIGLGDPGRLLVLAVGEVLRVLPQRVAGVLECPGVPGRPACPTAVDGTAGFVPSLAANLVEGVGGAGDDVESVGASHSVGASFGHHLGDPVSGIGADIGDLS